MTAIEQVTGDGELGVIPEGRKDLQSPNEVRWCPGCGDYVILATIQSALPAMQVPRERMVFLSGIGCAARFPYYMESYGLHSIHGRAPALATGLALTRPDLHVFVVTGDGDALAIGGNHLIHALRRNVNMTILMFNNQVYGLTKGQYSPTSRVDQRTASTPYGVPDHPFNPISLALGAEATFVARTLDNDRQTLGEVLDAAANHRGAAFVEIYQNCNVFNDGAFDAVRDKKEGAANRIELRHGEPIRFGADHERGVYWGDNGALEIGEVDERGDDGLVVHDAERADPGLAFALSRLAHTPTGPTPMGIFRRIEHEPTHRERMATRESADGPALDELVVGRDSWVVDADGDSQAGRPTSAGGSAD